MLRRMVKGLRRLISYGSVFEFNIYLDSTFVFMLLSFEPVAGYG